MPRAAACPQSAGGPRKWHCATVLRGLPALALAFGLTGCIWIGMVHGHTIAFHGTLVDAVSGKPISGTSVAVKSGDTVIYDGATDSEGVLEFTHVVTCSHGRTLPGTRGEHPRDFSIIFRIESGDHAIVEIPVRFDHQTHAVSLGEIRLIQVANTL